MDERSHLSKAQMALDDAGSMDVELGAKALPDKFKDLLTIATVQAHVATAEAMTRIADHLDAEVGGSPILQSMAWNLERTLDAKR